MKKLMITGASAGAVGLLAGSTPALSGLFKDAEDFLGTIYDLPGYMLVGLSCTIFGYCLRFFKKFPNDGIPMACMLWGMIFNPLMAAAPPPEASTRIWLVRHILMGLIIGAGAWMTHKYVLSRIESSIPGLNTLLANADQRSDNVAAQKVADKAVDNLVVVSSGTL
jgi:hypothetical protein